MITRVPPVEPACQESYYLTHNQRVDGSQPKAPGSLLKSTLALRHPGLPPSAWAWCLFHRLCCRNTTASLPPSEFPVGTFVGNTCVQVWMEFLKCSLHFFSLDYWEKRAAQRGRGIIGGHWPVGLISHYIWLIYRENSMVRKGKSYRRGFSWGSIREAGSW